MSTYIHHHVVDLLPSYNKQSDEENLYVNGTIVCRINAHTALVSQTDGGMSVRRRFQKADGALH